MATVALPEPRAHTPGAAARALWRWWRSLPLLARIAAGVLLVHALVACTASLWEPYSPYTLNVGPALAAPSLSHLFGTDELGRDVFSRVLAGERSVLVVTALATLLTIVVGGVLGILAGYLGGVFDDVVMRVVDILNSFPPLIVGLLVLSALGNSYPLLIVLVGLLYAPRTARILRAATVRVRTEDFVLVARARGESALYVALCELLPNVSGVALVEAGMRAAYAATFVGSLNVLGFGASPPDPAWGLLIGEGRNNLVVAPWIALAPAMALASLILAFNLFTDGIARSHLGRSAGAPRV